MLTNYVEGYQHIGIPTDDIKKTEEFYRPDYDCLIIDPCIPAD